ncbi:MAG: prolipoprotein diacylglyceryl transferase [Planctomycetota bacterium]
MHPKLIELPFIHLPIYSYGFMVMLGFLTAIFITARRAGRDDISSEDVFDIGLIAMISGIVGARILHIIYFTENFDFRLFDFSDGGMNIIAGIVGFFIPFALHYRANRKKEHPDSRPAGRTSPEAAPFVFGTFFKLLILSFVTAIVLARLVYLLMHRGQYNWEVFFVWHGGLVFYGGVILAIVSIIVYLKKRHIPVLKMGDLLMPGILLGLAFGRIGCFLNGCCYGRISEVLPWSVSFPVITNPKGEITGSPAFLDHLHQHLIPETAQLSLPVHPAQLYESLLGVLFFILLSVIWANKKRFDGKGEPVEPRHGFIVAYAGMLYGIERLCVEFFRGDNKSFITDLSYSQWVSIGLFVVSAGLFFWLRRKKATADGSTGLTTSLRG